MMKKAQKTWKKYRHSLYLLYLPIFLLGFYLLEKYEAPYYTDIYCRFDNYIPFCEIFVIPYLLWFPFVIGGVAFFLILSFRVPSVKYDFVRFAFFLIVGLTICLAAYVIWPSSLHLRPAHYPRDNVFTALCGIIQGIDPPVNVCPSMHVYTSLTLLYCLWDSSYLTPGKTPAHEPMAERPEKRHWRLWLRYGSLLLTILIVLSTVFIRQHSVVDVIIALILSLLLYPLAGWFGRRFGTV